MARTKSLHGVTRGECAQTVKERLCQSGVGGIIRMRVDDHSDCFYRLIEEPLKSDKVASCRRRGRETTQAPKEITRSFSEHDQSLLLFLTPYDQIVTVTERDVTIFHQQEARALHKTCLTNDSCQSPFNDIVSDAR
jgi:hypothetical protein